MFAAHPYMILFGETGNVDLKWGAIVARPDQEKSTRSEGVLPLHRASTSWTNSTPAPPLDSTLITLLQDQSPPTIHSPYTSARPRQRLTRCPNSNVVNSKGQYFEYNDFRYFKHMQYFTPELFGFFSSYDFQTCKTVCWKIAFTLALSISDWNLIRAESFPLYPVLTPTPPNHLHNYSNNRFLLKNWFNQPTQWVGQLN